MVQRRRLVVVIVLVGLAAPRWLQSVDCNLNGVEDSEDITAGVSEDCNGDGVADECEIPPFRFGRADFPESIGAAAQGMEADDFLAHRDRVVREVGAHSRAERGLAKGPRSIQQGARGTRA